MKTSLNPYLVQQVCAKKRKRLWRDVYKRQQQWWLVRDRLNCHKQDLDDGLQPKTALVKTSALLKLLIFIIECFKPNDFILQFVST